MLKTIIILPDGTEVSSGSNSANAIQSVTLTECVNSGTDLTLGSTCANALEATLITPGGDLAIDAGSYVTVLKQDGDHAPVPVGVFRLEKPTKASANTMKLTGYDRVAELDKDLTDWLNGLEGWPYSLTTFAGMVCAACGLTFKITAVPNGDFPVHQFSRASVTGRQLMRWLGEICCRFCRADAEGNIEFAWYTDSGKTVTAAGESYYFQNSLSYEGYRTAAIDAVQIRLANSADGALWPAAEDEGANSYIITDNAILNAKITEDLEPYLQVIREELTAVQYTPCKISLPASLDIRAGNTVNIVDKNGVQITAYVMTKTQTGQKDTLECTGSHRRDSTGAANSQSATANAASAAKNAFSGMTQEQVFNKLTNNGNIQGLFVQDNVWVFNAAVGKVANLIADMIIAGVLRSKDGGVYIDLDNGVGNLPRGTSARLSTWDDEMAGWTRDIDEVIDEFVTVELEKMQYNTIRDFAARLDSNSRYPEGVKLSIYKFRKSSGVPFASVSFEWSDGSRSHKTATGSDGTSVWQISEMEWL